MKANDEKLKAYARQQLAVFEAFRKLGFPSDDIYVAFYNGGELFTTLKQGGKEFNVTISKGEKVDAEAYQKVWLAESERWNTSMTNKERDEIYFGEFTEVKLAELAVVLLAKGFVFVPGAR